VRGTFLFLWGQSENISFSVKDDNRFGGDFPLSLITSNCNWIKLSKVYHVYPHIVNYNYSLWL
jgi:hypothetical protein